MQTSQVELRFEGEDGEEPEEPQDGESFCLVEDVAVAPEGGLAGMHHARVVVRPARGHKCERCWKFAAGSCSDGGFICQRCSDFVTVDSDGAFWSATGMPTC